MRKVLKILSHITLTLLFVGYIAYQFRGDPIAVLSGKQVSGTEVAYPANWDFTHDHNTIAVETRTGNPHSVTTICWVVNGDLYIPARDGANKDWPAYVLSDPKVRLKIGDKVYPAQMTRVGATDFDAIAAGAADKYPQFADATPEQLQSTWLFKVSAR